MHHSFDTEHEVETKEPSPEVIAFLNSLSSKQGQDIIRYVIQSYMHVPADAADGLANFEALEYAEHGHQKMSLEKASKLSLDRIGSQLHEEAKQMLLGAAALLLETRPSVVSLTDKGKTDALIEALGEMDAAEKASRDAAIKQEIDRHHRSQVDSRARHILSLVTKDQQRAYARQLIPIGGNPLANLMECARAVARDEIFDEVRHPNELLPILLEQAVHGELALARSDHRYSSH